MSSRLALKRKEKDDGRQETSKRCAKRAQCRRAKPAALPPTAAPPARPCRATTQRPALVELPEQGARQTFVPETCAATSVEEEEAGAGGAPVFGANLVTASFYDVSDTEDPPPPTEAEDDAEVQCSTSDDDEELPPSPADEEAQRGLQQAS